jgi:hypothetical protein
MRLTSALVAACAVGAEGFSLRSAMQSKLKAKNSAANVFAAQQFPENCGGMTTLNDEEAAWVKDFTDAIRHSGVRKSAPDVFQFQFGCWYAYLKKSKCGGLPPKRASHNDSMHLYETCKDPVIGFKKLFSDAKIVSDAERTWLLENYPNQRDFKGEEKEGTFSMAMDTAYKMAGKEMLCMMLKFIDDGCVTSVYGK